MNNPFPLKVRVLYLYRYDCTLCGRSDRGLELHHILGRISASAFNACLLCRYCHEHISFSDAPDLLKLNMRFLVTTDFDPNEEDYQFLRTNHNKLFNEN